MQNLQELLEQRSALERQIADLRRTERFKVLARIRSILDEQGLTPVDISNAPSAPRKTSKAFGKKVAPKYRHPELGVTWTGRGLKPRWLSQELASGKELDDFAI